MILVGQYDSPYVRRVAVSLGLLELPFTRNTISVFSDAEAMRRINPLGRIPSLILDDGEHREVLIDSAAILDHLDEVVGPARALIPRSGPERRRALRIMALATGTLDKAGAVVYERSLRPPEKVHQPWLDRCTVQLESGLAALEAMVPEGWFLGDRIMQPDVTTACTVAYFRHRMPEAFPRGAHPRLERLADACEALPPFRAAQPATDERMPTKPLR